MEWHLDYPNFNYWDRVTKIYIGSVFTDEITAPALDYLDNMSWIIDPRDDIIAMSNIGSFYDPVAGKLYVTFEKQRSFLGKPWEIRTSHEDIHTNGWASGTTWQSFNDAGNGYNVVNRYANFTPVSPGQDLYVAVRMTERSTFTQIKIKTA